MYNSEREKREEGERRSEKEGREEAKRRGGRMEKREEKGETDMDVCVCVEKFGKRRKRMDGKGDKR